MYPYPVISNGKQFIFHVVQNTTAPCPQCGLAACGREDIIWYEEKTQRVALIFDGGYFDLALETFLNQYVEARPYEIWPAFLRAWNESRGWSSCWDYEGHELDIEDFLAAVNLLKNSGLEQWISAGELAAFQALAETARKIGAPLKIVRG